MGKLITLLCESMTAVDLKYERLNGFTSHEFDMSPVYHSATALWKMQTDSPLPKMELFGPNHFAEEGHNFISSRFKTRIASYFWPKRFDPRPFDSDMMLFHSFASRETNAMEPNAPQWGMHNFVRTLDSPENPHQWFIYWPTIGHVGFRVGDENKGVPKDIHQTLVKWFGLIRNDILSITKPSIPMLIHSDHGTARTGHNGEEFTEGFVFARGVNLPARCTWDDIRRAELECLER